MLLNLNLNLRQILYQAINRFSVSPNVDRHSEELSVSMLTPKSRGMIFHETFANKLSGNPLNGIRIPPPKSILAVVLIRASFESPRSQLALPASNTICPRGA